MQSEKSALSRAMQQNKELKDQLNVLEDAYIKLTNTNADLLNQLQAEQHINKQLNASVNLKDEEINSLKIQSENKVQNAIDLIEKSTSVVESEKLNQDWEGEDDKIEENTTENEATNFNKNNDSFISSNNSIDNDERSREIERITNSYNELINTLNDKDLLISQLNNELNELKVNLFFLI